MPVTPQSTHDLFTIFEELDDRYYNRYQQLEGRVFFNHRYSISFLHIQNSPGAFPASVCRLALRTDELGLADWYLENETKKMATADYLLRAFHAGVKSHVRQNRGAQGSGSYQPLVLPPQVLQRNLVEFDHEEVTIAFHISLPGSHHNRILGRQAKVMFTYEISGIVDTLKTWVADTGQMKIHCAVVEDMVDLQSRLERYGLVAFIGDGAVLPRQSGISEAPMAEGALPLYAPEELAVEVELTNGGRQRGLGIRPGVNVLIGGGYHGKSTLIDALVKGVYPHIPGDGRELVVTHPEAVFICSEEGRAVTGLDISGFIDNLPGKKDVESFSTQDASGSTSEAAAIIESVLAGAKFLLLDEDSSATNFLIKDQTMRKLLPQDTITPLFDRVRELYLDFGISTLIVVGGSSEYLGVADHVIAMQDYQPISMTDEISRLQLVQPEKQERPLQLSDQRLAHGDNFDPSFCVQRLGKNLPVRIKPLRGQDKVLEYGNEQVDLSKLRALVDPYQVLAVGYALFLARYTLKKKRLSPSELADVLYMIIEKEGLDALFREKDVPQFFARPRRLELAGAINRFRNLNFERIDVSHTNKEEDMVDSKEFEALKAQIERLRDEIKLKIHLGAADARDELEKLDKQWDELMKKYKPITQEMENTAGKTIDALGAAADELKAGFERLRKMF